MDGEISHVVEEGVESGGSVEKNQNQKQRMLTLLYVMEAKSYVR